MKPHEHHNCQRKWKNFLFFLHTQNNPINLSDSPFLLFQGSSGIMLSMESFKKKEDALLGLFKEAISPEQKYRVLIDLGHKLRVTQKESFTEEDVVEGCQSFMLLRSRREDVKLYFEIYSEALISSGLAYLLVEFYSGESAEDILKTPPTFLEKLDLTSSLTPGRSNGLAALYHKIRQLAAKQLISKN